MLFDDRNPEKGVVGVSIEKEMQKSYLEYAMSVIVSRAIPDVRDGLKPVQRRILYSMYENSFFHNRAYKKSARVVGEVISKYHPHGDVAIYEALVGLAQDFSTGEPLVDGQGNFGSIDDDPPAAMRYTEVRLKKLAETLLEDIDKNTVEWRDNYDGSEREPCILPAAFPNILVNGSEGIAVGMATNIPPHNLGEVILACQAYIKNGSLTVPELLQIMPAPDFPTGATIINGSGASSAMINGRGSVMMRGKAHFEELKGGREAIIITEIPYQVIKSRLIEKIAELVKEKRLEGISNVRDESSRQGMRIVVEIKRDSSSEIVLNNLYQHTSLQSSFAINCLVLNGNMPQQMGALDIIKTFVSFREKTITARLVYLLGKARDRAHVVLGLRVAVDSIDKIISIIRQSADTSEARQKLLAEYWPASSEVVRLMDLVEDKNNEVIDGKFRFTEEQVKSILEMRLSKLTGLEREKIDAELTELGKDIAYHLDILSNREKLMAIMSEELQKIYDEFAGPRRTNIENIEGDVTMEDLIEKEDMLVMVTRNGYIKRNAVDQYNAQRRGGKGKFGIQTNDDDDVVEVLVSNTHSHILFFSDRGKVYRVKTYTIPLGSNQAKGRAIVNLVPVEPGDRITNFLVLPEDRAAWDKYHLVFATKKGNVRRSDIADFANINANGKIAIRLDEDDFLVGVRLAEHNANVMLATKKGMVIRFEMEDLRIIKSRTSDGVRGINLAKEDCVIALCILENNENNVEIKDQYLSLPLDIRVGFKTSTLAEIESGLMELQNGGAEIKLTPEQVASLCSQEQFILTINENGFGKRTSSYEYRITGRAGKGVINMDVSRGDILASFLAYDNDDLVLVSSSGKVIRCSASSISIIGRNTKGVKVLTLEDGEKVASVAKVGRQPKMPLEEGEESQPEIAAQDTLL